jgi:hypothetical protein
VTLTGHRLEPKYLNFSELRDAQTQETRFRGLQTILKRRLRAGSNLFALGPPIEVAGAGLRTAKIGPFENDGYLQLAGDPASALMESLRRLRYIVLYRTLFLLIALVFG